MNIYFATFLNIFANKLCVSHSWYNVATQDSFNLVFFLESRSTPTPEHLRRPLTSRACSSPSNTDTSWRWPVVWRRVRASWTTTQQPVWPEPWPKPGSCTAQTSQCTSSVNISIKKENPHQLQRIIMCCSSLMLHSKTSPLDRGKSHKTVLLKKKSQTFYLACQILLVSEWKVVSTAVVAAEP